MNPIEIRLLELIEMAETPLYSAYCWLEKVVGASVSLGAFLEMVDGLIRRDALQLWVIDGGRRLSLETVPADLEDRYRAFIDLDPRFDPLSLTLTLGGAIEKREPDWEVDLDVKRRRYVLTALPEAVPEAYERMTRLFAPTRFDEDRRLEQGVRVRIEGTLREA